MFTSPKLIDPVQIGLAIVRLHLQSINWVLLVRSTNPAGFEPSVHIASDGLIRKPQWLCLLIGAWALSGCSAQQRIEAETIAAKTLISDADEEQLGLQVKQELEQKQQVKYIQDPAVTGYVHNVANRVFQFASKERPNLNWRLQVIDDPKTVNAFATPGAYVYLYSGLLLTADNEAELAGVLAHESGHVVARHAARNMVDAYGLEAITALALGKNPSLVTQIASSIAANGALLAHSRSDENEADEYGARYSSMAGYDPRGLVTFFQKLQAKEGKSSVAMTWLSDHPATPDRVTHITQFIVEHQLSGSDLGAERLAPIKQRLARLH
jgi:predicted Zn-dependent protease